jgi:hypothetical protein
MKKAQVAVCFQTNTNHINTVWAERTIVKIFNLLVYPVTSRLYKDNNSLPHSSFTAVTTKNLTGILRKLLNSPLCPRGWERTERSVVVHLTSLFLKVRTRRSRRLYKWSCYSEQTAESADSCN